MTNNLHSVWKSPKMSHLRFSIFVLLKLTYLVTLFDRKLQVFKNSPKLTIFGIFNELLSTQNVNVARFARNVECDFFGDFQTLCQCGNRFMMVLTARISFRVWQWFFCPRRLLSKSNFCYYRSTNEDKCLQKVQKTSGDILFFFWHNWKSAL